MTKRTAKVLLTAYRWLIGVVLLVATFVPYYAAAGWKGVAIWAGILAVVAFLFAAVVTHYWLQEHATKGAD